MLRAYTYLWFSGWDHLRLFQIVAFDVYLDKHCKMPACLWASHHLKTQFLHYFCDTHPIQHFVPHIIKNNKHQISIQARCLKNWASSSPPPFFCCLSLSVLLHFPPFSFPRQRCGALGQHVCLGGGVKNIQASFGVLEQLLWLIGSGTKAHNTTIWLSTLEQATTLTHVWQGDLEFAWIPWNSLFFTLQECTLTCYICCTGMKYT